MIRLEPRAQSSRLLAALAPMLAALAALALTAIPLLAAGAPIFRAYQVMFNGAFGSLFAMTEVVARARWRGWP